MNTPFTLHTKHPVADQSVDHLRPRGTKNDSTTNREFVWKIARRVSMLRGESLKLLDLGCAGGGLVQTILEHGLEAMGIEGSDYSRQHARAAWPIIPDHLFTADISKPFVVMRNNRPALFHVVTAWEVLEHLSEDELREFELNVRMHLDAGGFFIGSVNSASDRFEGVEYHATIQDWSWWKRWFEERDWLFDDELWGIINPDWVRGPYTDGAGSHPFVFRKR